MDPKTGVPPEFLSVRHAALIVVDVQNDNSAIGGLRDKCGFDISMMRERVIPNTKRVLDAARNRGNFIVYLRNSQLQNGVSRNPHKDKRWGDWLGDQINEYQLVNTWGHAVVDELAPEPGDPVIDKFRPSGFVGTPLDLVLRRQEIKSLIFTGAATDACVESTIRVAECLDYDIMVLEDCVGSTARERHEATMVNMRDRYCVTTGSELVSAWHGKP